MESLNLPLLQKTIISQFYKELESYELEIALIDIYLIYFSEIKKDFKVNSFFITQATRDFGIDALICDDKDKWHIIQISANKKQLSELKGFLLDENLHKYDDIICKLTTERNYSCKRVLITLEKSREFNGITTISGNTLINIIEEVWDYLSINYSNNINGYKDNIRVATTFWELINVHRRKKRLETSVNYVNVMLSNYYSIVNKHFNLTRALLQIEECNYRNLLDLYSFKPDKDKKRDILLLKSKLIYDGNFDVVFDDVKELIEYLLELIGYNLVEYEIVPKCTYISVKLRENMKVIGYYSYDYNKSYALSYVFGFKCLKEDIKFIFNKIEFVDGSKKIVDACNFNTPIILRKPNLRDDKKYLDELFRLSELRISN